MIQCFSTIKTSMRILHCQLKRLKNRKCKCTSSPSTPFSVLSPLSSKNFGKERGGGGGGVQRSMSFYHFHFFFDKFSNFANKIIHNQKPELLKTNCQWIDAVKER